MNIDIFMHSYRTPIGFFLDMVLIINMNCQISLKKFEKSLKFLWVNFGKIIAKFHVKKSYRSSIRMHEYINVHINIQLSIHGFFKKFLKITLKLYILVIENYMLVNKYCKIQRYLLYDFFR